MPAEETQRTPEHQSRIKNHNQEDTLRTQGRRSTSACEYNISTSRRTTDKDSEAQGEADEAQIRRIKSKHKTKQHKHKHNKARCRLMKVEQGPGSTSTSRNLTPKRKEAQTYANEG